jgi:hypothetical protein
VILGPLDASIDKQACCLRPSSVSMSRFPGTSFELKWRIAHGARKAVLRHRRWESRATRGPRVCCSTSNHHGRALSADLRFTVNAGVFVCSSFCLGCAVVLLRRRNQMILRWEQASRLLALEMFPQLQSARGREGHATVGNADKPKKAQRIV